MTGQVRQVQVTFDCADPGALAGFWIEALGYKLDDPPAGFDTWDEALDAFGVPPEHRATRVERFVPDGSTESGHIVMRDPEGNEFCLD